MSLLQKVIAQWTPINQNVPSVIISHKGVILKYNDLFNKYILKSHKANDMNINNVIHIHTCQNSMIGISDDAIWGMNYEKILDIFNIYSISLWHIAMIDTWSDFPFSMTWLDNDMKILSCNQKFTEEFGGTAGESIRKYLTGLNPSMLLTEEVMQIKADQEYYRVFIRKDHNLFLLTIENISDIYTLQNQIADNKPLISIGHAASSAIHDFRNILTVISGYCDIGLNGSAIPALTKISDACQSAQDLVNDLLSLIKNRNHYARMCNLSLLFQKMKNSLHQLTNNIITIHTPEYSDIAYVPISDTALERIITNIVVNAYESTLSIEKAKITLKLDKIFFKRTWENFGCTMIRGWYMRISCTDNGPGISDDVLNSIFKPFYTSKQNGNGLGLSSALIAIKEAGGGMQVLSRINIKTKFDIYLPIIQQIKIKDTKPENNCETNSYIQPIIKQIKQVLIVEDNEDILKLCSMTLKKEKYDVMEACNAEDAINLCMKHKKIDLLITDLNMPGMDGLSMIDAIQKNNIDISNILIISGYDKELLEAQSMKFPENAYFMLKPMKLSDLQTKVHNIFINE